MNPESTSAGPVLSRPDFIFLLRQLNITSARQALDIVSRYYPADRISVKTQHLLEGLFEEGAP